MKYHHCVSCGKKIKSSSSTSDLDIHNRNKNHICRYCKSGIRPAKNKIKNKVDKKSRNVFKQFLDQLLMR
jgi:transcription elongation factor Elf1